MIEQRGRSNVVIVVVVILAAVAVIAPAEARAGTESVCSAITMGQFEIVGHCQDGVLAAVLEFPHALIASGDQQDAIFVGDGGIIHANLRFGGGLRRRSAAIWGDLAARKTPTRWSGRSTRR